MMLHTRWACAGATACLMASTALLGCGSAPPPLPSPPVIPPAWAWPAGQDHGESAAWAPLLTPELHALLRHARSSNISIRQAALAWQAQQLEARRQGLRVQPSLGLSYSGSRPLAPGASIEVDGVRIPAGDTPRWSHGYGLGIGAGYEPDLWDRLAHTQAQQDAHTQAAEVDIAAAQQALAAELAEAYWTAVAQARHTELARQRLALAEQIVPKVTARVREGLQVPQDISQAAIAARSAHQQVEAAKATLAKSRLRLAVLLNQAPPGPELSAVALPETLPPGLPDAPPQVLERRPDVHRARLSVDAALAASHAAQAARYPSLSLSTSLGTGGSHLKDWLAQPLFSLGVGLAVPLIDWRRLDIERDQAHNSLEQAALALRDKVHTALAEVQTLLIEQERMAQAYAAVQQQHQQTTLAERLALAKLEVGQIAPVEALQARMALIDSEQSLHSARLDIVLNRLALLRALALAPAL